MNKRALIVFGRNPVAGEVKTRLGTEIGAEAATALYEAWLVDTLNRLQNEEVDLRLYLSPTRHPITASIQEFDLKRLRQRGSGLGPRMTHAIQETFAAGYKRVVMIGSDVPNLPKSRISRAFDLLGMSDAVVLNPVADGGYCLVGFAAPHTVVFENMTFSHARVMSDTLSRCTEAGLKTIVLPTWYDVDTHDDVMRLAMDIAVDVADCPRTRSVLIGMGLIENANSDRGSASEKLYFGR